MTKNKKEEKVSNSNMSYDVFKFWRNLDYKEGTDAWRKLGEQNNNGDKC